MTKMENGDIQFGTKSDLIIYVSVFLFLRLGGAALLFTLIFGSLLLKG